MSFSITFDTLKYTNILKEADVPAKQAEAQTLALQEVIKDTLISQAEELKAANQKAIDALDSKTEKAILTLEQKMEKRFADLELRLTMRMGAMLAATAGLIVTLNKLL